MSKLEIPDEASLADLVTRLCRIEAWEMGKEKDVAILLRRVYILRGESSSCAEKVEDAKAMQALINAKGLDSIKQILEGLSCAEKVEVAKAMLALIDAKGIGSTMILYALRKLLFDQLIRDQIQLREGHPFFFSMFKFHKSCLWSGAEFVEWR